ncbi:MAG: decaprenyl-phosphate phosphoribosyltransferase [Ignavibacteriales bacterium]|nr:decaprenyl-phosphate phosphoribosyltransferase [Ignavibacteriales bacterium]
MKIKKYLKLIRASHWIKNIFLFVPLVYSKKLFNWDDLSLTLLGFMAFNFASSIVYVLNDIVDKDRDRLHPKKRLRPIPAGDISVKEAYVVLLVLGVLTILFSFHLNYAFEMVVIAYILLNTVYSFKLKNIVLLDIFSIAGGFILRVAAGTVVIGVAASSWLVLITLFISLFLAVMKRMSESDLLSSEDQDHIPVRRVLENDSKRFIDQISAVSAGGVIVFYALYTVSPRTVETFGTENLIYTTAFVVFGIFRYMYLVYQHHRGENTIDILLHDVSTILNALLYVAVTLLIVYKVI